MKPDEKDFKSYSLRNLNEWVTDALDSDATTDEIYDTIVSAIKERNRYHNACLNAGEALLRKFHVVTPPHPRFETVSDLKEYQKFWHDVDITGDES